MKFPGVQFLSVQGMTIWFVFRVARQVTADILKSKGRDGASVLAIAAYTRKMDLFDTVLTTVEARLNEHDVRHPVLLCLRALPRLIRLVPCRPYFGLVRTALSIFPSWCGEQRLLYE